MDWICMLLALTVALCIRQWVAEPIRVKGSSMNATLQNGDMLWATKFDYLRSAPSRHDVVICFYPGRYVKNSQRIRQYFVKRVIALPGETVEVIDSVVHINGQPLEEPYLDPAKNQRIYQMEPVTVGENEVFVMGDHRDNSNDSRRIGAIGLDMVRGHVRGVFFPLSRARWLRAD